MATLHSLSGIALLAGCVLVGSLAGCGSAAGYRPSTYSGDGTLYKMPEGSPRYDLELEPISLTRPSRTEFHLENLPPDNLEAVLCVDNPSPEKLAWIDKAGVKVSFTLMDLGTDRTSVKYGYLTSEWGMTPESFMGDRADYQGVWFRPARHASYTLVVDVWVDHPESTPPAINATPHVRGGGYGTH